MKGFKCGWVRRFHFADGLEGNYQLDEHRASLGFQDTLCALAFQASFPCFPSHCSLSLSLCLTLSHSASLARWLCLSFPLTTVIFNFMLIQKRVKGEQKAIFASSTQVKTLKGPHSHRGMCLRAWRQSKMFSGTFRG